MALEIKLDRIQRLAKQRKVKKRVNYLKLFDQK